MNTIRTTTIETPLGRVIAAATDDGVCLLEFGPDDRVDRQLDVLEPLLKATTEIGESPHLSLLEQEMAAYFAGSLRAFTVPTVTPGTEFQQRVWTELKNISFGRTIAYRDLALSLNAPSAVRAVGGANGANRVSLVIPCHRVIGADGTLTGFGGGIETKQRLLDHERTIAGDSLWSASLSDHARKSRPA